MQADIRRHADGAIDIDHYRAVAVNQRREAAIDTMRGVRPALWAMAAGAALILALAVTGAHRTVPVSMQQAAVVPQVETR